MSRLQKSNFNGARVFQPAILFCWRVRKPALRCFCIDLRQLCYCLKYNANLSCLIFILLAFLCGGTPDARAGNWAEVDSIEYVSGYLARLLINENPFPGENGYKSVEDSKIGMVQILWVLHSRIHHIPPGYRQEHIANIKSDNIIDVITAQGQCDGFSRDQKGNAVVVRRVEERLGYLLAIANKGSKPGKFSELINYGQGLASAYVEGGINQADRFAGLEIIQKIMVTGRAYSWMTDKDYYNPGGNFVSIPDSLDGSIGGNRFFTLKRVTPTTQVRNSKQIGN